MAARQKRQKYLERRGGSCKCLPVKLVATLALFITSRELPRRNRTLSENLQGGKHVVFTTFACATKPCSELKKLIEYNTETNIRNISTRYVFVRMHITKSMCNSYGMPFISTMFQRAQALYPDARTYTYLNGDILLLKNFVDTVDFVSSTVNGEFFIVGARTNVRWYLRENISQVDFDLESVLRRGTLMDDDAQDYFVATANAIKWSRVPNFVIGRPGYDNWLVDHVYHNPNVLLIDATETIAAIHQTDEDGNRAQGGSRVDRHSRDYSYNRRLAKGKWDHGRLRFAQWRTTYINSTNDQHVLVVIQKTQPVVQRIQMVRSDA